MSMAFSDFLETTADNKINTFESSASSVSFLGYMPLQRNIPDTREVKRKERLVDLFLEIPTPITGLSTSKNILTGAASGNDRITGIINKPPYEITEAAEHFIGKQKKSVKYKEDIMSVAERVTYFLRKEGIDAEVHIDLFTDPEYSNWIEPKIQIETKKEQLQRTYEIFDELLNYSYFGISQKTLRRLSVTIDSKR
jgi:hypothetical protein